MYFLITTITTSVKQESRAVFIVAYNRPNSLFALALRTCSEQTARMGL